MSQEEQKKVATTKPLIPPVDPEEDLIDYNDEDDDHQDEAPAPPGGKSPPEPEEIESQLKAAADALAAKEESSDTPQGTNQLKPPSQAQAPNADGTAVIPTMGDIDWPTEDSLGAPETWTREVWERIIRRDILYQHDVPQNAENVPPGVEALIREVTRRYLDPIKTSLYAFDPERPREPLDLEYYAGDGTSIAGIRHVIPPKPSSEGTGSYSSSPYLTIHEGRLRQLLDMERVVRKVQIQSTTASQFGLVVGLDLLARASVDSGTEYERAIMGAFNKLRSSTRRPDRLSEILSTEDVYIQMLPGQVQEKLEEVIDLAESEATATSAASRFVRNVGMSPEGQLDDDTVNLAQELPIPHAVTPAVEDEETAPVEKGTTPPLFMFSQQPMCECPECTRLLLRKRPRDGEPKGLGRVVNLTPAKRARSGNGSSEEQQQPEEDGGTSSPANSTPKVIIE